MELCAAVLLCRLYDSIKNSMDIESSKIFAWTDSLATVTTSYLETICVASNGTGIIECSPKMLELHQHKGKYSRLRFKRPTSPRFIKLWLVVEGACMVKILRITIANFDVQICWRYWWNSSICSRKRNSDFVKTSRKNFKLEQSLFE